MARALRMLIAACLLAVVLLACERSAEAQVYTTYYAPAVPVTAYYAPVAPVYVAPYKALYAPAVVTPGITTVRVRRPWLAPRTTVIRQRSHPVVRSVYYWPY